jgi:hypothetical protein
MVFTSCKAFGVGFTRIEYSLGSISWGPYYHKAHPLGFYCTLIVLIQSTKKEMTKWKPFPISYYFLLPLKKEYPNIIWNLTYGWRSWIKVPTPNCIFSATIFSLVEFLSYVIMFYTTSGSQQLKKQLWTIFTTI